MNYFFKIMCCTCLVVGIVGCKEEKSSIPDDTIFVSFSETGPFGTESFGMSYKELIDHNPGKRGIGGEKVSRVGVTLQEKTPNGHLCTFDYVVDGEEFIKKDVLITGKPQVIDGGTGWQISVGTHDRETEGKLP